MVSKKSPTATVGNAPRPVVVVPCYNEAKRIAARTFEPFTRTAQVLFVNDGSRDETVLKLTELCEQLGPSASFFSLPENRGKAEAVRAGLQAAIEGGAKIVGYYDADGATAADEALELAAHLADPQIEVVLASRIALLGREVRRGVFRHHSGRVFATLASLVLRLRVYDTQCGAKFFRVTPLLSAVLEQPFTTRWAFDVELLGRLLEGTGELPGLDKRAFIEVPLRRWEDIGGSTLSFRAYPKVFGELLRIGARGEARRWLGR